MLKGVLQREGKLHGSETQTYIKQRSIKKKEKMKAKEILLVFSIVLINSLFKIIVETMNLMITAYR